MDVVCLRASGMSLMEETVQYQSIVAPSPGGVIDELHLGDKCRQPSFLCGVEELGNLGLRSQLLPP